MKEGDVVYVHNLTSTKWGLYKDEWTTTAIIIRAFGSKLKVRAWHVLLEDGTTKVKLAKQLKIIQMANGEKSK